APKVVKKVAVAKEEVQPAEEDKDLRKRKAEETTPAAEEPPKKDAKVEEVVEEKDAPADKRPQLK
ncbi:unnamed protein product, partial [Polarella glacialis]